MILFTLACAPDADKPADTVEDTDTDTDADTDTDSDPPAYDCSADYAAITAGVRSLDLGEALPSQIIVHGDHACPIVLDESNRTFVAAATHGAGRAFHIGHEGMLSAPEYAAADGAQLVRNVVAWAGGDSPKIGVEAGMDGLASWLVAEGFDATVASVDALPELDLYIATSYADRSDAEVAAIQAWVEAGGGWVQS